MTIRRWRTHFTRLVLIGAMAATVAVGSVAVGPGHEAAAARSQNCTLYLASARAHRYTGDVWRSLGYYEQANTSYGISEQYYDMYDSYC